MKYFIHKTKISWLTGRAVDYRSSRNSALSQLFEDNNRFDLLHRFGISNSVKKGKISIAYIVMLQADADNWMDVSNRIFDIDTPDGILKFDPDSGNCKLPN